MTKPRNVRRGVFVVGTGLVLAASMTACGNVTTSGTPAEGSSFPSGPVTLTIGQAPGGSTDLIGRALAENAKDALGVAIPVVNKPGANSATKEVAAMKPDGQNLILLNASLITITSLTVPTDQAVTLDDLDVITGISQDDYVLVTNPSSGYKTIDDLKSANKRLTSAQPALEREVSSPRPCSNRRTSTGLIFRSTAALLPLRHFWGTR